MSAPRQSPSPSSWSVALAWLVVLLLFVGLCLVAQRHWLTPDELFEGLAAITTVSPPRCR